MSDADWEARATKLLGVTRGRTRARGFAPWSPREETEQLLAQIKAVLQEYVSYLPLTCRQIFYRLVGAHGYSKTEKSYANLCEALQRARRARVISMDVIRDDGGVSVGGPGWPSVEEYLASIREDAEYFRLDRTAGQKTRLSGGHGAAARRRLRSLRHQGRLFRRVRVGYREIPGGPRAGDR
jgi:hypothetical protein